MMQSEYGSASSKGADSESRSNKQRVMLGLCAASMLLVVTALALNQSPSASVQLSEKMAQIQALATTGGAAADTATHASQKAAAIAAASDAKSPNWPGAKGVREAVSVLHKAATAPEDAATKVAAPKQVKAVVVPPKEVKAKVVAPKADKAAAAGTKVAKSAAPGALRRAVAAGKEASAKQAAMMRAALPRIAVGTSLANATAPAAEGNSSSPAEPASSGSGEAEAKGKAEGGKKDEGGDEGVEGDQFSSPMGNLNPTGIMSVFFNEKIMLTALGVIGSLLILICCFARNADCALS